MSKVVPWDAIPDQVGSVLPTGTYRLEIESMEEVQSSKERYMLKATYRVLEPKEHEGMPVFDNYAIGNEKDPQAEDPKSWEGVAAARWKDVIKKSATVQARTVEETCKAAVGQQLMADISQETDKDGAYAGRVRNRIAKTYRVGEKDSAGAAAAPGFGAQVKAFRPGQRA